MHSRAVYGDRRALALVRATTCSRPPRNVDVIAANDAAVIRAASPVRKRLVSARGRGRAGCPFPRRWGPPPLAARGTFKSVSSRLLGPAGEASAPRSSPASWLARDSAGRFRHNLQLVAYPFRHRGSRHVSPELGAHDKQHLQIVASRRSRWRKLLTADAEAPDETRGDCGAGSGPASWFFKMSDNVRSLHRPFGPW